MNRSTTALACRRNSQCASQVAQAPWSMACCHRATAAPSCCFLTRWRCRAWRQQSQAARWAAPLHRSTARMSWWPLCRCSDTPSRKRAKARQSSRRRRRPRAASTTRRWCVRRCVASRQAVAWRSKEGTFQRHAHLSDMSGAGACVLPDKRQVGSGGSFAHQRMQPPSACCTSAPPPPAARAQAPSAVHSVPARSAQQHSSG